MKWTIFHKVVFSLFLLLIPILTLFAFSNSIAVSVVQKEVQDSLHRRLTFLQQEIDTELESLTRDAVRLCRDPEIESYATYKGFEHYFDIIHMKKQLESRLHLVSATMRMNPRIAVYFPRIQEAVSTDGVVNYSEDLLSEEDFPSWHVTQSDGDILFTFYSVYPYYYYTDPGNSAVIVEIQCDGSFLSSLFNHYNEGGQGSPFLYHLEYSIVADPGSGGENTLSVAAFLDRQELGHRGSFTASIEGTDNLVYYVESDMLDCYLVDCVPIAQTLSSILGSQKLFYGSACVLVLTSILFAFLIYRNVQSPLTRLNRGLAKIKEGDFSIRLSPEKGTDFQPVFTGFNEMAAQMQLLVENVYQQQLISRDARMKQMQSQINPHFLYNCLFFIANMARLENCEAVERMSVNLGEYFKYTTRLENPVAKFSEEITLLENYLEIQKLRMPRISYEISVDPRLLSLEVPRLLLQPLVENAVIHGLEPKPEGGRVWIEGSMEKNLAVIRVSDSGVGLTAEEAAALNAQLGQPMTREMGYGAWNICQRLLLRYGAGAQLKYEPNEAGGTTVKLVFPTEDSQPSS